MLGIIASSDSGAGSPAGLFLASLPAITAFNGGNVTLTFSNFRDALGNTITLQADDLLVCAYIQNNGGTCSTSSSGWTEHADLTASSTRVTHLGVYSKVMTGTPDTDFVGVGPGGNPTGCAGLAMAFRGVDTTTPLDVAIVTATGTGSSRPNPGSITPSTAGALIVAIGAGAATTGAAYTLPGDLSSTTNHWRVGYITEAVQAMIGMGIKTDWTSGAFDPGQWAGASDAAEQSWAAVTLALRPA
jgi:hypothetical protein